MEYKHIYEEYKKEHPEELVRLNGLKEQSAAIEQQKWAMARNKLRKVEECRRKLYGE